jgi:hypothetical protein
VVPRRALACVLVVLLGLVAAACSDDGGGRDAASTEEPTTDRPALEPPPEVTERADEWPLPGRDYANARARTDATITSGTIDGLEEVWSVRWTHTYGAFQVGPNGVAVGYDKVFVAKGMDDIADASS